MTKEKKKYDRRSFLNDLGKTIFYGGLSVSGGHLTNACNTARMENPLLLRCGTDPQYNFCKPKYSCGEVVQITCYYFTCPKSPYSCSNSKLFVHIGGSAS